MGEVAALGSSSKMPGRKFRKVERLAGDVGKEHGSRRSELSGGTFHFLDGRTRDCSWAGEAAKAMNRSGYPWPLIRPGRHWRHGQALATYLAQR